ncbi:hypothetical protein CLV63_12388 [Murinocardiopsis flavida]|uniref:CDP-glycerol:poly(Glycerophosphate) glycerophosphotransferase n=1 Tax=Murinocardiopsis flavida TaxID=645275 RepID=A0A2P8CZ63_9ACTN|nr:glycerophosphotransferase [Murinocardiopsis flavida]PSK90259.1 hypothetical protein CLV63_12388 [Murinocardiopsis flavida]
MTPAEAPRILGVPAVVALGVLASGFALLAAAVLAASVWTFAAGAALVYAATVFVQLRAPRALRELSRYRLGSTTQALLRQGLLLALLGTTGAAAGIPLWAAIGAMMALFCLQFGYDVVLRRLRRYRSLPVVTRNIDLDPLDIPDGPPAFLVTGALRRLLLLDAAVLAGVLAGLITQSEIPALAGPALAVVAGTAALAALVPYAVAARRMAVGEEVVAYMQTWIDGYGPEVLLYYAGTDTGIHRADMWLEPLVRQGDRRRPLVVLRDRSAAAHLAPTPLPVLCVPDAEDLAALDFGRARVALYPDSNAANTDLLRNQRLRHVLVGHGDRDGDAVPDPVCRAYDQVWTAGKGGRDRYASARSVLRDDAFVEIGRPQLDAVARMSVHATAGPVPTVLYAPTWEGTAAAPRGTSLVDAGEALVELLLGAEPPVRVLYRPHPATGTRDPRAAAAHRAIVAMIEDAGRAAPVSGTAPGARRLAAIEERIRGSAEYHRKRDEARGSRDDGAVGSGEVEELQRLEREWNRLYWLGRAPGEHLAVLDGRPDLYSCFDHADLLISDISGVITDFIATGKPYAVANCAGVPDMEFRTAHPTAAAAYLLRPDGRGLKEALRAVADTEADVYAGPRAKLASYLLGPEEPTAQERFADAVDALYRTAAAEIPQREPAMRHGADGGGDGGDEAAPVVRGANGRSAPPRHARGAAAARAGNGRAPDPVARP